MFALSVINVQALTTHQLLAVISIKIELVRLHVWIAHRAISVLIQLSQSAHPKMKVLTTIAQVELLVLVRQIALMEHITMLMDLTHLQIVGSAHQASFVQLMLLMPH